jgi:hypothetical protein
VRRKTSITVIAWHELPPANRGLTGTAGSTVSAGDHGRNDDVAAHPFPGTLACCNYATRDFVPKSKRERGAGGYTVKNEANIGMADAAADDLYYHLVGSRLRDEEFVSLQTLSRSDEPVAVSA